MSDILLTGCVVILDSPTTLNAPINCHHLIASEISNTRLEICITVIILGGFLKVGQ